MENFLTTGFNIWTIVKFFSLAVLGIYIIFAFVITRQVKVMTETLTLGFEPVARFLSLFHFLFAVLVLIIAVIVL